MNWHHLLEHERILWHHHFWPSFAAGVVVALIAAFYEMTISNVVLFASVGASAAILTNNHSHHLTKLHTTIVAYLIAGVFATFVYSLNRVLTIPIAINLFLLIFLVTMALYLTNVFHPPAITGALSFILLDRPVIDLLYLFVAIVILLIVVRLLTYVLSQRLPMSEFITEFRRSF